MRSLPTRADRPLGAAGAARPWFSLQRLLAYTIREALELLRDPIRLGFSLLGTTLLMLVFGFGVSTDVNNLSFAVLDHDQSPESRAYLEELRGSSYFVEKAPLADYAELDSRLKSGNIGCDRNPAQFRQRHQARTSRLGQRAGGWRHAVPGRDHSRLSAGHASIVSDDPAVKTTVPAASPPADIEVRFKYNQDFDSIYAMVPSNMAMLLGAVSGDPDGAWRRARKGTRLDHQPLRDAGHPASNFCSASSSPMSRLRWPISP